MLDLPIPDKQMMHQATTQLSAYLGETEGGKLADKWEDHVTDKEASTGTEVTWAMYKTYWKPRIHRWQRRHNQNQGQEANQVEVVTDRVDMLTEQVNEIQYNNMTTVQALQAENRGYQEELTLLRNQQALQQAMQAEHSKRQADDSSATSAITEYFAGLQTNAAATTTTMTAGSSSTPNQSTRP